MQSSVIGNLLSLPARYWSIGPSIAQAIFDAGLRQAQKAQAIATYDETVANYRDAVLTAFQEVEDNLAALSILEREAAVQDEAVKAARESATIALNQYRAGTANYLTVVVLQTAALNSERTALDDPRPPAHARASRSSRRWAAAGTRRSSRRRRPDARARAGQGALPGFSPDEHCSVQSRRAPSIVRYHGHHSCERHGPLWIAGGKRQNPMRPQIPGKPEATA